MNHIFLYIWIQNLSIFWLMKKVLLFIFFMGCLQIHGQNFWISKATSFSQINRGINDISIVDNTIIWAKAYDGASNTPLNVRQFTLSIDGGENWISGNINLGTNQNLLNISSITATSATTAWVTAVPSPTGIGGVWKTTDGGNTWIKQATALFDTNNSYSNFVYFWDENNGITQGDPSGGYFEIYTTTDGGTNWTRIPSANIPAPLADEYGYAANYDVSGNTIWFGTNKGRFYKSTNKGLNWTVSQSPISDFGGNISGSYSFADANKGILVSSAGALYKTVNGGTTWTSLTYTGNVGNRNLEYIPNTNTIVSVGTTPNSSTSYTSYSTDDGLTWTEVMTGTQVTTLKFKDLNLGFGGGFTINSTTGGIFKYNATFLDTNNFSKTQDLLVYPNPATNLIYIDGKNISKILVFDMTGKEVMAKKINTTNTFGLDISSLSSGIYILNTFTDSGFTSSLKFSKQ